MKDYNFKLSIGNFSFKKDKHIDFFTLDVLYSSIETFVTTFELIKNKLIFEREIFNPATSVKNSY